MWNETNGGGDRSLRQKKRVLLCFYQKPKGISKVPTHSFSPTFAPWWIYQIRPRASTDAKRVREKKEKLRILR
jgi:hypothetical protein